MTNIKDGEWQQGLFGCCSDGCDAGACFMSWFCPCVQFGENMKNAGLGDCCLCCCGFTILLYPFGLCCILSFIQRTQLRRQYKIKGNDVGDCCIHCWCLCCALVQEAREIRDRGRPPKDHEMTPPKQHEDATPKPTAEPATVHTQPAPVVHTHASNGELPPVPYPQQQVPMGGIVYVPVGYGSQPPMGAYPAPGAMAAYPPQGAYPPGAYPPQYPYPMMYPPGTVVPPAGAMMAPPADQKLAP